jgi:hypothetical protein
MVAMQFTEERETATNCFQMSPGSNGPLILHIAPALFHPFEGPNLKVRRPWQSSETSGQARARVFFVRDG